MSLSKPVHVSLACIPWAVHEGNPIAKKVFTIFDFSLVRRLFNNNHPSFSPVDLKKLYIIFFIITRIYFLLLLLFGFFYTCVTVYSICELFNRTNQMMSTFSCHLIYYNNKQTLQIMFCMSMFSLSLSLSPFFSHVKNYANL